MPQVKHTPKRMEVSKSKGLAIEWEDGCRCFYPINLLRAECPCANCREERASPNLLRVIPEVLIPPGALSIQEAKEVGGYALSFRFSDGHSAGIYQFQFLRELCQKAELAENPGA